MGFDLGNTFNNAAEWACTAPIIQGVVSNPLFTALLITALVAVVLISLCRTELQKNSKRDLVRSTLYIFFMVTSVMFVHHYAVDRMARKTTAQKGVHEVFAGLDVSRSIGINNATPVVPMGYDVAPNRMEMYTGGALTSAPRADNVAVERLEIDDVNPLAFMTTS